MKDQLILKGHFKLEVFSSSGELKRSVEQNNLIVTQGKNSLLDVTFNGATPITAWYMGLVNNSGYTAHVVADTMTSHGGWTEFTGYTEATRPEWTAGTPASGSITNSTAATFTINTSGTLKGAFITSNNTKAGTAGVLWSVVAFSTTVPVSNTDVLKLTYTLPIP